MAHSPTTTLRRRNEPRRRPRSDAPLREIVAGVGGSTGGDFFDRLTIHLSRALDMEFAFVGEVTPDGAQVRTRSVCADGGIQEPFTYALAGTPCERVVNAETCVFAHDVQARFPDDTLLASLDIESYAATPLRDHDGTPLGLLAVVDGRRLHDPDTVADILEIFAARAAAELERTQAETALHSEHVFRDKVLEQATNAIYAFDVEGRFTLVNRAGARLLDRDANTLLGCPYTDVVAEEEESRTNELFRTLATERRPVADSHTTVVRPNGARRRLTFNAAPLMDSGRFVGVVATAEDITDRLNAEEAQRRSETYLRTIIDNEPECVKLVSPDGIITDMNAAGLEMLEAEEASAVVGHSVFPFIAPQYHEAFREMNDRVLAGEPSTLEFEIIGLNGTRRYVETRAVRLASDENRYSFVLAITRDVTERRRAEAERTKLSSVVEQAADAIFITDRKGMIEYVNPAFEQMTGHARDEVAGATPSVLNSGMHDAAFFERLWRTLESGETFRDVFVNRCRDGSLYTEDKTISPLKDADGRITHYISTGQDITEHRAVQDRARYLAYNDALTDLPNRALLTERLGHTLARAPWNGRRPVVLVLGLDRFKLVNESLGHPAGDQVLKTVAQRLEDSVREGDTVARLSGDVFGMLLEDVAAPDDVPYVINKLRAALSQALTIDGQELFITASIGASIYPDDGDDADTLLHSADTAMFRAKDEGRDAYQFY